MHNPTRNFLKSKTLPPIGPNHEDSKQGAPEKRKSFRITTKKSPKKKKKLLAQKDDPGKLEPVEKAESKRQQLLASCFTKSKNGLFFSEFAIDLSQKKHKLDIIENITSSLLLRRGELDTLSLNLNSNELSYPVLQKLGKCVRQLKALTSLTLKMNKTITGKSILNPIATGIASLNASLVFLDLSLSWNSLQEQDVSMLAQSLYALNKIKSLNLDVSWNSITEKCFKALSEAIEHNENLAHFRLSLFMSEITDETLRHAKVLLKNKPSLLLLDMNFKWNKISAQGIFDVILAVAACPRLKVLRLDFYNNLLENTGFETLQRNICLLSKEIEEIHLNLYENQITKSFTFLITELLLFKKLRKLSLTMEQCIIDEKGLTVVETFARSLVAPYYQRIKLRDLHVTALLLATEAFRSAWRGKKIFRKEVLGEIYGWLWAGKDCGPAASGCL